MAVRLGLLIGAFLLTDVTDKLFFLFTYRFNEVCIILRRFTYTPRDRIRFQLSFVGLKQRLEFFSINTRRKPYIEIFRCKNHRHPVVKFCHDFVGRGGKNRVVVNFLTIFLPIIIETCKREWFTVFVMDEVRLFRRFLPFIEAARRNQTTL
jgi:hypothetical protein